MINYTDSLDGIAPDQLGSFFLEWNSAPTPERHLEMLRGSSYVVLAMDSETKRVVGFVTAISDGVSCAYIPHLEVLPGYRSQGIGSQLVKRLLSRLEHLYMVDLICDEDLRAFYQPLGFNPHSAMIRRNYDRQSCE